MRKTSYSPTELGFRRLARSVSAPSEFQRIAKKAKAARKKTAKKLLSNLLAHPNFENIPKSHQDVLKKFARGER